MSEVDDMERVRLLRDTVPWPTPARLADGRARLLAEAETASRDAPRQPRFARHGGNPRRVIAIAAAAVVAVAAGVAGYAISARTGPLPHRASAGRRVGGHPAGAQAVLAAKVLQAAAAHVALQGVTSEPSAGQWIYSKTVSYESQPKGYPVDENWITFDGGYTAYYQGGQLIVQASPIPVPEASVQPWPAWYAKISPKTAYDVLASLSTTPHALLAVIAQQIAGQNPSKIAESDPLLGPGPWTRAQLEFDYLAGILWNAAGGVSGPPAVEAAVYRALATLPGISVQQGLTDTAGNPAIGISDDGGYGQLLVDPASYQVIGLRQLSTGVAAAVAPSSLTKRLRALLTISSLPAQPALPAGMPLAQLRAQFAQASQAEQVKLLAQWTAQWAQALTASAQRSVLPKGTLLESIAYALVTEVPGPGQN
jgi:hypothetical protein